MADFKWKDYIGDMYLWRWDFSCAVLFYVQISGLQCAAGDSSVPADSSGHPVLLGACPGNRPGKCLCSAYYYVAGNHA